MRRPQFSLKSMVWLMAVVAAFFAGRASQIGANQRKLIQFEDRANWAEHYLETHQKIWKNEADRLADEIERLRRPEDSPAEEVATGD